MNKPTRWTDYEEAGRAGYYDDPNAVAEEQLRAAAGIVVEKPPPALDAAMRVTKIGGGEHAVLRHHGPYAHLPQVYTWLYGTWLPQSGREVSDAVPLRH